MASDSDPGANLHRLARFHHYVTPAMAQTYLVRNDI